MRQQKQARLRVRIVAVLCPIAKRVRLANRSRPAAIAVIQVGVLHRPTAVEPLGHVAMLIKGVEGRRWRFRDRPAREQPVRSERVARRQRSRAVALAHRLVAVVQEVDTGAAAPRLLPRPQTVPVVAICLSRAVACEPVLGVKGEGGALVGCRVAVPVVAVARVRHLVVRVEGVRRPLEGGRVAGAGAGPPVVAEGVGVAAAPRAGFLRHLAAPGRGRGRAVVVGIGSRSAVGGGGVAHRGRDGQPVARPVVAARRGHGEVGEDRAPARLVHLVAQAALILSTP